VNSTDKFSELGGVMLLFEELRTFNHNAKYDHYFRVYCASHKSLNFNINISFSESLQGEPVHISS
jgi:hypothetical protein